MLPFAVVSVLMSYFRDLINQRVPDKYDPFIAMGIVTLAFVAFMMTYSVMDRSGPTGPAGQNGINGRPGPVVTRWLVGPPAARTTSPQGNRNHLIDPPVQQPPPLPPIIPQPSPSRYKPSLTVTPDPTGSPPSGPSVAPTATPSESPPAPVTTGTETPRAAASGTINTLG